MIPDDVKYLLDDFFSEDRTQWYTEDYQRVKDWLDSQPTMPQAPWEEAPEWAQWWAVDANGEAQWHTPKPVYDVTGSGWYGDSYSKTDDYIKLPLGIDWRTTLQRRPEAEE